MKFTHMTRTLAALLALLMLCTAIGCGKAEPTEGTSQTTTAATEATAESTAATEATTCYPDDLPEDLSYNGQTITFLYREEIAGEFYAESVNGDIVNDAILARNNAVQDRLGVTLKYIGTKGNGSNIAAFKNFVGNAFTAGESEYDLIASYSFKINQVLSEYLKEANIELIDFKLEFGKTKEGQIVLADEISPDTCRFWDSTTHEKLDKDRFRRDLGGVEDAYNEVMRRLMGNK